MKSIFRNLLIAAATFGALHALQARPPGRDLAGEPHSDPCRAKAKCVTVFIAPWCGACKAALPPIRAMLARWNAPAASPAVGLRVIVGMAEAATTEPLARSLGSAARVDEGGTFERQHSIRAVPTWLVTDGPAGKVLTRFEGAFSDPRMIEPFARQRLGLE